MDLELTRVVFLSWKRLNRRQKMGVVWISGSSMDAGGTSVDHIIFLDNDEFRWYRAHLSCTGRVPSCRRSLPRRKALSKDGWDDPSPTEREDVRNRNVGLQGRLRFETIGRNMEQMHRGTGRPSISIEERLHGHEGTREKDGKNVHETPLVSSKEEA